MGMGMGMGDGRWEVGSGSYRCGCQVCSTHGIKDEHKSNPMFVPFSTCMVVRALCIFFKVVVLDVFARCVQHTE